MGREDKSSVELLKEYAQKRGYSLSCILGEFELSGMTSKKRVFFYRDRGPFRTYFVAVDGHSASWKARCGVYSVLRFQRPYKLIVSPQHILDDLSNIFTRKDVKIGHEEFDKKFFIRCENKEFAWLLLHLPEIQYLISNVCLQPNSSPIYFFVEPDRFFEPLENALQPDESVIGFETLQNWITDEERIEIMLNSLERITQRYSPIISTRKTAP